MRKRSIFGLFYKKEEPKQTKPVWGITESEYNKLTNNIRNELQEARLRQKSPDAHPTKYMLGLMKALEYVKAFTPHIVAEVTE